MIQYFLDLFRGYGGILGSARSPKWSQVRNKYLTEHPNCEVCGTTGKLLNGLEIHHCETFSRAPEKELDPNNLICLCRKDHLLFGHLNSWKSENTSVRADALLWKQKILNRP